MVNSNKASVEKIIVKYFEPGHHFVGADEQTNLMSLKHAWKVYDFNDYFAAVGAATKNTKVIQIDVTNFLMWENRTSQYKLSKAIPRPYINDMVQIKSLKETLKQWHMKQTIMKIMLNYISWLLNIKMELFSSHVPPRKQARGITKERKGLILSKLTAVAPKSRLQFWEQLSATESQADDFSDKD